MADVVLVYPPYQRTMAKRGYSPLGLPYVASALERNGRSTVVVDSDVEGFGVDDITAVIRRENPSVVGISVFTHTLPEVYRLVNSIKAVSDCEIVVGGPHITADPGMTMHLGVGYGIRGEAEREFPKLVEHLLGGSEPADVGGLVESGGDGFTAKPPCMVADVDSLPRPARHLIRTREYKYSVVLSSRGCPYACVYCAEPFKTVRYRNPVEVVDEVEELAAGYGVREVDFGDSVFTLDREHALEVCGLMRERRLGVRWSCITRADLVDRQLLSAMRESGCRFVSFGVESGVEAIRFLGGKGIGDDTMREAFRSCRELGIRTRASMIFGNPGETVEDMRRSIEFARALKPDYALFNVMQIFPGTRIFETAKGEGLVDDNLWVDYMLGARESLDYHPPGVSAEDVYRVSGEAFRRFYFDWGYIRRKAASVGDFDEVRETLFILLAKAKVIPIDFQVG